MASPSGKRQVLRVILFCAAKFALLAFAGFSYQVVAFHTDAERFRRPGQLVNVGGFRLNLYWSAIPLAASTFACSMASSRTK